jgi:hypothetical protein
MGEAIANAINAATGLGPRCRDRPRRPGPAGGAEVCGVAEAERLKEEQASDENRHPPEPARQDAAPDHKQPYRDSKETAEDFADTFERERHQLQPVGDAGIVLGPARSAAGVLQHARTLESGVTLPLTRR